MVGLGKGGNSWGLRSPRDWMGCWSPNCSGKLSMSHLLHLPSDLHGIKSVPVESCPQENLGVCVIRSDRMDTLKLRCLCKKRFSACFV